MRCDSSWFLQPITLFGLFLGFGFLAENAEFAEKTAKAGLIFIGPSPHAIAVMGSKIGAKKLLSSAKYKNLIPVIPGYHGDNQEADFFLQKAKEMGFPVLLKASAGGGGKGMKIAWKEEDVVSAVASAKREGLESFGSDKLLMEVSP